MSSVMVADGAVVCDASVLAAMVFEEPASVHAQALTRSRRLLAPTLLRYEMAHIAMRKCAFAPDERARIESAYDASLSVPLKLVEPSWKLVLRFAREYGLSAYDASYLQVALALRVPLATLDARLAQVADRFDLLATPGNV